MTAFTSHERLMLTESAERLLSAETEDTLAPDRWMTFAEMGWLALALPERFGGLQADLTTICLLCEQLGRALAPEPFVTSSVLPGACLALSDMSTPEGWIDSIASGNMRLSTSLFDLGQPVGSSSCITAASDGPHAWCLDGDSGLVSGASSADVMLVAARMPDDDTGLFVVESGTPGVKIESFDLMDGGDAARWCLSGVKCSSPLVRYTVRQWQVVVASALRSGVLAHCAQTVGAMTKALEITQDYVRQRKQFGRAISSYQTIQHRLVDLYVEIEEARALTFHAAETQPINAHSDPLSAGALALVSQVASHVWQESIQMHGAIGMTEEYAIGGYVKRLALASRCLGDHDQQLERLASIYLDTICETDNELSA